MAPPKYPENPFAEKRDGEIGALFEKARAHKNFKEARKGAQEAVNIAILGEDDEEQKVDILFKDHYKPAEYITGKPKPAIEYGKTHLLLGNVDSDAFDSNLERGPQYYEDLQKNAQLFIELKDYIDINFPALKDPTKKARILEMIEKTKEFAGPFDLKSFKAFCTQNKFKKAEVFGKNGLSQVLLAFSRAIEPVEDRSRLKIENFKITDAHPNPLFYRIELGIGKAGSNDKDRYSIVLKSGLNDEGQGTYDPGDIDRLAPPPPDDEEEPDEPTPPAEPAQPTTPPAPGEPAQPAAPTAPVNPDTPPPAPPETPPAPDAPPTAPTAPADPAAPAKDPATTPPTPDKPADTPTPAPIAGLNTVRHDIKIDDVDTKLETNAPDGFTYEITQTDEPKGYAIKVYFADPKHPDDPAKTGSINFGKNPDYTAGDPLKGHQFSYNFKNTPGTASSLDIWKFCELKTDPTKPSITITKLPPGKIAAPSISYFPDNKQIMVCPTADIGKRKHYDIDDQSGQNLKFEYFNEDGKQSLHVTSTDGLEGDFDVATDITKPLIRELTAADYPTDIFQHYDFAFTEGPGTNPGTLKITPISKEPQESSHEISVKTNPKDDSEVAKKYTLKIKAPLPEKARHILNLNGQVHVTFGGQRGVFKIDKVGNLTFKNGVYMKPGDDLWTDYEVKVADTEITIEKRKEKPTPRLEYDKKAGTNNGTVTFITKEDDSEKRAPYKIENPHGVIIKYKHDNDGYCLTLEKTNDQNVKQFAEISDPGTLSPPADEALNLLNTYSIDWSDPSGATPGIFKIYEKTPADVTPREPSSPGPAAPEPATGTATKLGSKLAAAPTEEAEEVHEETATYPFGTLIFKFPGATFERSDKENTIELKTGGESYTIELSFTGEARFVGKDEYIHTHTISSTCDDKNECLVEIIPIEPLAVAEAPAPPAEAPEAATVFQMGALTFTFSEGSYKTTDKPNIIKYTKDDETFTIELPTSPDGKGKILNEDVKFSHTVNITDSGKNKYTVDISPAIVNQIAVSEDKDKITVTLNNGNSKVFDLVLPANKKNDIIVSNDNWQGGGPFVQLQYQKFIGYIEFHSLLKSLAKYTPETGNINDSYAFFGNAAPFTFSFEKGQGEGASTITIISNKEAREKAAAEKVKEEHSKRINGELTKIKDKFKITFTLKDENIDEIAGRENIDTYIKNLSKAVSNLSPEQRTILGKFSKINLVMKSETCAVDGKLFEANLKCSDVNLADIKKSLLSVIEKAYYPILMSFESKTFSPKNGDEDSKEWFSGNEKTPEIGDFKVTYARGDAVQGSVGNLASDAEKRAKTHTTFIIRSIEICHYKGEGNRWKDITSQMVDPEEHTFLYNDALRFMQKPTLRLNADMEWSNMPVKVPFINMTPKASTPKPAAP